MTRLKRWLDGILLLIFLASFTLAALSLAEPFTNEPGRDGGYFLSASREVAQGKLLYVDIWDTKGPLIFWINALGLWLGRDLRWGVWGMEFLFLFLAALFGFRVIQDRWGRTAGLFGISWMLLGVKKMIGPGNFTEEYALLFTLLAIFTFTRAIQNLDRKRYPLFLGALLMLNFLLRPNNIVTQAGLILILGIFIIRQKGWKAFGRTVLLLLAGVILVAAPVLVYFISTGTLDEMVFASLIYNYSYSFATSYETHDNRIFTTSLVRGFQLLGPLAWISLISYGLTILSFTLQARTRRIDWFLFALLLAWPLEIIASSISGRGYGHYFLCWLPVMGMLAGQGWEYFNRYILSPALVRHSNGRFAWASTLFFTALLVIFFHAEWRQYGSAFNRLLIHREQGVEFVSPVAQYLRENSASDDEVLVWGGQAGINFMSQRSSSTPYSYYPLFSNSLDGLRMQTAFLADLQQEPPAWIVDGCMFAPGEVPCLDDTESKIQGLIRPIAQNTLETLDFINTHYEKVTVIQQHSLYRLKDGKH